MTEIAVVGAGTMGHALALVFALGGHAVRLTDSDAATLERAPGLMRTALDTLRQAGEVAEDWDRLGQAVRICPALEETVAGAEIVVEAIIEQPEAKRVLFLQLDTLMAEEAVLASNTSYLDIFPLVPERRQARTLIVHWYTPPYLIDLVDIVAGPQTDPAVVERLRAMVAGLGKVPVVLRRFVTGYIANRIQSAIALEVYKLIDEGVATAREVDDAVIHGLGLRMLILGVMAKADFTGLELLRLALGNGTYAPPPVRGKSDALDRLVAEGRTGVMAGRGFFDWGDRTPQELFQERDRRLLALKRAMREIGPMLGR